MSLLEQIDSPADLRRLSEADLDEVCRELRQQIITVVSQNGGHLASSLGVVELTVALHCVFCSPSDPIVWDVGNQAYAHKLLTGRRKRFDTLRQAGGISGFTQREESEHDVFGAGHASTSISAALGIAEGKRLRGDRGKVIAVIGDGGMTGGLAFEGLNHAGSLDRDLVVVLNDNGMFISPRVGAMSTWLSRQLSGRTFNLMRRRIKDLLVSHPRYGEQTLQWIRRLVESTKALFTPGMLFEGLNFQYVGPVDGHDLGALLSMFRNVKTLDGPVLVHVRTVKGKGLPCAENDPTGFHGVSPFCIDTGKPLATKAGEAPSFTSVFSRALVEIGAQNDRLLAVTAAMPDGTGLQAFADRFPDRFYDVGIAEGHAVTFAAGLACQGYRPLVAIYSTFLQRSYDMILHDVCLQKLPVLFVLDRAGIVGEDGPTHHGLFDLSYLSSIPNLTILAPADEDELVHMLHTALSIPGPAAIRYPRGSALGVPLSDKPKILPVGRGRILRHNSEHSDVLIVAVGPMVHQALQAAEHLAVTGISASVVDARFVKPLDQELILRMARSCGRVLTVEENTLLGGFGSAVSSCLHAHDVRVPLKSLGVPDRFLTHGHPRQLRAELGLDKEGIVRTVQRFVRETSIEPCKQADINMPIRHDFG